MLVKTGCCTVGVDVGEDAEVSSVAAETFGVYCAGSSKKSSNNGANKVSNSLRVIVRGSADESGKFRRLISGHKQFCSEAISVSSSKLA